MTYATEAALCEEIIDRFETTGVGIAPSTGAVQPPYPSTLTRIANLNVFSGAGTGSSGYSDIYTDVYTDNTGTGTGGQWVPSRARVRFPRPMPEPFTGQNQPYDPTYVDRWVRSKWHGCRARTVRTIESFTDPGALHGDGISQGTDGVDAGTDDTDEMNNVLAAALRFAHDNNVHLVVSLTRTYRCDGRLFMLPWRTAVGIPIPNALQQPALSIELTGPGKFVRPRYNNDGSNWYVGTDRTQAHLTVQTDRTILTSFGIDGPRPTSVAGGRNNNYESQHAVWAQGVRDFEARNLDLRNYMGDGFAVTGARTNAVAGNPYITADGVRFYNNRLTNGGRHHVTPLANNLDVYGNRLERNASHIFDTETTGSGDPSLNTLIRNNLFIDCNGDGWRGPSFPSTGTGQCRAFANSIRGLAFIENVRVVTSSYPNNYGCISLPNLNGYDVSWQQNLPPRTVTQVTTVSGSRDISSPNFGLTVANVDWQGEDRAAVSGTNIPPNSYIDVLDSTSLRLFNTAGPGGTSLGATGSTTTGTATITCVAGVYGDPHNVGPDHAALGEHETQDVFMVRNMWSRNNSFTWVLGSFIPAGYQGANHEGGPGGVDRFMAYYNYGPWRHGDSNPIQLWNVTDETDTHLTISTLLARNPGLFEQPTA